ncbi:Abi family protein [Pseudomonas sp. SWRI154]|uniref:Abi family protein n=1 Tax=Pseudomonas sp. SWRI154 TaxID=2745501 RepID=UPI001647AB7E|nr:Abi family protein [Pseudomonas sp. SWRI154]MBC3363004.1 Abi family protein [Pseudomonas sp. SWRI154]
MVWQTLEAKLSTPRMSRYLKSNKDKQARAAEAYVHNMKIAESLVSVFHVLEVALRNGIQKEMTLEYGQSDWYEKWNGTGDVDLQRLYEKVAEAKRELRKRKVTITPDNIVAELSFGFWTSLFNRATIHSLSKPLMRVFYSCPKGMRKPDNIRTRLNKGRDLRNRCFHHEPLLWQPLFELHRDISEIIKWIDPGLHAWIANHDRVPDTLRDWVNWKEAAEPPQPDRLAKADDQAKAMNIAESDQNGDIATSHRKPASNADG